MESAAKRPRTDPPQTPSNASPASDPTFIGGSSDPLPSDVKQPANLSKVLLTISPYNNKHSSTHKVHLEQGDMIVFGRRVPEGDKAEELKQLPAYLSNCNRKDLSLRPQYFSDDEFNTMERGSQQDLKKLSTCHGVLFYRNGRIYLRALKTSNKLFFKRSSSESFETAVEQNHVVAPGEAGDWEVPLDTEYITAGREERFYLQMEWSYNELLCFACSPQQAPVGASAEIGLLKEACQWGNTIGEYHGGDMHNLMKALAKPTRRFVFIGHADAKGADGYYRLGFTKPGGKVLDDLPPHREVADLLSLSSKENGGMLEMCFLNGCCSEDLGRFVHETMECVVCWRTRVFDRAARLFSKAFFRSVASGNDYERAFRDAVAAVHPHLKLVEPPPGKPKEPYVGGVPVLLLKTATGARELVPDSTGKVVEAAPVAPSASPA